LSTKGAGSNSPGCSEAEPWVQKCTAKLPELPVLLIAVPFHPAHPGIQIGVGLSPECGFNGKLLLVGTIL